MSTAEEVVNSPGTRTVDPTQEYVAGGTLPWMGMDSQFPRVLPWAIDDLTADFGHDLYERMLNDAQVDSSVETLKLATIVQGLTLDTSIRETEPHYDKAKEIRDFCQRALDRIEVPFLAHTIYDMLDAIVFGNKVAELVYKVQDYGVDEGKIVFDRIKVKPRTAVAFVVDPFYNIVGILGRKPNEPFITPILGSFAPAAPKANVMPRRKFAIFTFRPRNGDPRGTSIARPAYNAWWLKTQTYPEYLKYLAQFALPSLVAVLSEHAQPVAKVDETGALVLNEDGSPVIINPTDALMDAMLKFRNGTVLVVPFGTEVSTPFPQQPDSAPFTEALRNFNQEITKAILCQTLATEEGKYQARAAAQTHQDVLDLVIYHCKVNAAAVIHQDILWPLVEINYGPEAAELYTPTASLSETERHDFAQNATAIARLTAVGFIHESQLSDLDALLSLPPRSRQEFGMPPGTTDQSNAGGGGKGGGFDEGSQEDTGERA